MVPQCSDVGLVTSYVSFHDKPFLGSPLLMDRLDAGLGLVGPAAGAETGLTLPTNSFNWEILSGSNQHGRTLAAYVDFEPEAQARSTLLTSSTTTSRAKIRMTRRRRTASFWAKAVRVALALVRGAQAKPVTARSPKAEPLQVQMARPDKMANRPLALQAEQAPARRAPARAWGAAVASRRVVARSALPVSSLATRASPVLAAAATTAVAVMSPRAVTAHRGRHCCSRS